MQIGNMILVIGIHYNLGGANMQDDILEYIEYSFDGIKVSCDDYNNEHSGYLKNDICKKICELSWAK